MRSSERSPNPAGRTPSSAPSRTWPNGPAAGGATTALARRACAVLVFALFVAAPALSQEIRGICLASLHSPGRAYGSEACREELRKIRDLGANWVAINDHAWMQAVDQPALRYRAESPEGDLAQVIRDAHALGLKVLVKPHVWSRDFGRGGKWHGDIRMATDADWDAWFAAYGDYVLHNARIAQEANADGFCIGVEYEGTIHREAQWRKLIADVRKVYSGPICYSAAFLEWQKITWWDAVDVISITAYWPVAKTENPTDEEIRAAWSTIYAELEPFSSKWNKPVVFGEIGYTTHPKTAREPWSHDTGDAFELQARLYRIALEEAAKRPFVKGVFAWKWFTAEDWKRRGGPGDPYGLQDKSLTLEVFRALWRE